MLHGRLAPCFARREPFAQVGKYVAGLMSDLPRKNGWTLAEHAGDVAPDRMQRLLNHAVWDHDVAQGVVRNFVAEHVHDQRLVVPGGAGLADDVEVLGHRVDRSLGKPAYPCPFDAVRAIAPQP
jgi:hypothetical protein